MFLLYRPFFSPLNEKPPTIYALLNSICNFGKEEDERTKIRNLARVGRTTIFDFDYPLSTHISKEEFETQILNHYMQRRIGFETLTAFQLQLENKLLEIMPIYNKLFDMLEGWDLFNDGEITTRVNNSTNNVTTNTTTSDTSDRRYSDTPQNQINNIKSGSYMTDYNYDQNAGTSNSTSNGGSDTNETITRTPADKISIYREFIENKRNIMTQIYKELDCLFYGLI